MNRLHDTQRDFARFVFRDCDDVPDGIVANGLTPDQRMAIYRNNTLAGLTEALRELYPVVNRLVGDGFFNRLALAYLDSRPPTSACLLSFGGEFAALIAEFADARGLAYLPDIARLEWFFHEAYHAENDSTLALPDLARVDPADYVRLAFKMHPSARFMASPYPLDSIWRANQPDCADNELIDLKQGGCRLLLFRPDSEVCMIRLSEADYLCLSALAAGDSLLHAVETTLAKQPDFSLEALLRDGVSCGWLSDYYFI
ncbi:DNA-binding domain-containing protein [Methylomonas methanica]|uniref:Putative DNA-binding domain-containing protein n=1 Tax=Methylomonas methanica (strain DSM 25384 / MC09) TaxID=857087 RepID=F9ZYT3_METMM|nr:DNA-binding domain-containing protein [Methylomonas methanica]AEF98629.1 Protein of unknown function DUF2063 [Methylomonas methanica MC09]